MEWEKTRKVTLILNCCFGFFGILLGLLGSLTTSLIHNVSEKPAAVTFMLLMLLGVFLIVLSVVMASVWYNKPEKYEHSSVASTIGIFVAVAMFFYMFVAVNNSWF